MRDSNANRWLILAIISSALFLIVIDMTVLYTALPTLTHDLRATASEKLWIVNAYGLVVAGLLLGMGTLGDRLGHKRLFVVGLLVFGLASLCAAFSTTPALLIASRALLAVGAAMMMPATLSILRLVFTDDSERAMAIGMWAAVASGGAAFGPVLGGVLLEHFWWGSVFLINVPVVVLALVLAIRLIPNRPGNPDRKWDLTGSVQVMVGLIGLAYAIKELGKPVPSFQAALIAALLGGLFMALFVRRQRRSVDPMLEFSIFLHPGFGVAVLSALVAAIALMGMELVYTQRLQLVLDMSPLEAGIFILPLPLASFISGPLAGHWLPRLGSRRMLTGSLLLSGLGMAGCMLLYKASTPVQMGVLFVLGAGLGAAMTAASSTIMDNAPPDRAGMAASVEEVSYELGGAIGVTLMGSILSVVYDAVLEPPSGLPADNLVRDSLDEAMRTAESLPVEAASNLLALAKAAFDQGFVVVMGSCAVLLLLTALTVWRRYGRTPAQ
ncbi:putative methyl viologen resistance protein [Pusillimonas sp. T7-7]|uniref:MFS transporter n=1 Tax=Pusillimonas sp. (strain T7-7) TaxID=1007105 RepID=UPI00020844D0|nr:MFS transporter [Pusillimonas sp. T7-7]AEC20903.1 putative methyl viologen resistance protein [Pusillimonas sp. T7-7]